MLRRQYRALHSRMMRGGDDTSELLWSSLPLVHLSIMPPPLLSVCLFADLLSVCLSVSGPLCPVPTAPLSLSTPHSLYRRLFLYLSALPLSSSTLPPRPFLTRLPTPPGLPGTKRRPGSKQVLLAPRPDWCDCEPAPDPRDVVWKNIAVPQRQARSGCCCYCVVVVVLVVCGGGGVAAAVTCCCCQCSLCTSNVCCLCVFMVLLVCCCHYCCCCRSIYAFSGCVFVVFCRRCYM